MNVLQHGRGAPASPLERLAATRSLPQILRMVRDGGRQAIGCDGVCVLLREQGALRAMGCAGLDGSTRAFLTDPDGAAAKAVAESRLAVLTVRDRDRLVVAPFDVPGTAGALVARWEGAGHEAGHEAGQGADQVHATERLSNAVADALNGARLMDCLPHLMFTVRQDGLIEPLGRLWSEYGLDHDEGPVHPDRLGSMLHPDERDAVLERWSVAIGTATPIEIEHRLLHRDGQYRWFRTLASPADAALLPAPGAGIAYVGTSTEIDALVLARTDARRQREDMERRLFEEITDRGRTEARLAKAERIEAVGQLTSGVAHDFNNLLTVIIGNIEFLEASTRDGGALDTHAQGRMAGRLAAMREAAERGGNLTRQLLAFARRQRLEPKPTDLNDTVAELRGLLPAATGGGIEVATSLQDGLWPAFVDRTQIERMILNLALNAHDAMEVGGAITIATANRPVGPEEADMLGLPGAGDYVEISVSDTGRGMSPSHLARAFEPFFTTKPPGKGSGLGLAQVYGFARQSGGIVTLASTPGEGTLAAILLPRAELPAVAEPATLLPLAAATPATFAIPPVPDAPQPAAPQPSHLVLLVDDDLAVRDVTSTIVAEAGYRVIEAASGAEAMERLAEAGRVDLMVTDYAMPGMNGHELSRAARKHQPDLKVLFVTGYADLTALADIAERRILLKPFRSATLLDKIGGVLAD